MATREQWEEMIRRFRADIEEERQHLDLLVSGGLETAEREPNGDWTDTTQRNIKRARETISVLEDTIRKAQEHIG